jgi:excisionase family DNA binding protein
MIPDPWMSVAQVAEYIGVSQEIIYRWIKERNMPAHRIGKFWKFRVAEVDGWILGGSQNKRMQSQPESALPLNSKRGQTLRNNEK